MTIEQFEKEIRDFYVEYFPNPDILSKSSSWFKLIISSSYKQKSLELQNKLPGVNWFNVIVVEAEDFSELFRLTLKDLYLKV